MLKKLIAWLRVPRGPYCYGCVYWNTNYVGIYDRCDLTDSEKQDNKKICGVKEKGLKRYEYDT